MKKWLFYVRKGGWLGREEGRENGVDVQPIPEGWTFPCDQHFSDNPLIISLTAESKSMTRGGCLMCITSSTWTERRTLLSAGVWNPGLAESLWVEDRFVISSNYKRYPIVFFYPLSSSSLHCELICKSKLMHAYLKASPIAPGPRNPCSLK